jgi:sugar lactone lactonase YvrE
LLVTIVGWEVVADDLHRPEAPCPDGSNGIWCSDIFGDGAILRIAFDGQVQHVHTRAHVGGIVPHVDGGIVASGHDLAVISPNGDERSVHSVDDIWGFNDITTDPGGSVFAGRHDEPPSIDLPSRGPSLWRLDVNGQAAYCYGDLTMNNGLRVSPDGARLYHADTLREVIWVSDLDVDGMPRNRRVHYQLGIGMPDGMAIDEDECLWIAAVGGGAIVRVTPAGMQDQVIEVPRAYVSAVCFAGPDRRELVVTAFGGEPYDADHNGCILRRRVDAAGLPLTPAGV